jgi:deaminated glutathione amidase
MDIIALPEVFAFRGSEEDYRNIAEPLDGRIVTEMAALARKNHAWLLAGSVVESADDHVYNTSVLLNRNGEIAATYRKIHLFEAHLDDGTHIRESDSYDAGGTPVSVDIEGWRAGLAICYDLRFPELFRHYSKEGAHLLFAPSNFTQRTGKDHWEVLLRARAIENQSFVVAPDQCGANPATGVVSHGHSLALGPWGEELCEAGDEETILMTELDPAVLTSTRHRIPALEHRVLR